MIYALEEISLFSLKRLDLIDREPEELRTEVLNIV